MNRKRLRALCKRHNIHANITNAAMRDALASLHTQPSEVVTPLYSMQHLEEATEDSERTEKSAHIDENMQDTLVADGVEIQHQVSLLKSKTVSPVLEQSEELHLSERTYNIPTKAGDSTSRRVDVVVSNNINNDPKDRTSNHSCHFSRTTSLNLTEMAEQLDDDSSEVDSLGSDTTSVSVCGYKVKPHYEDILRSIISKHGDIAANSSLKSNSCRSLCLELLCCTLQKLTKASLLDIEEDEVKNMLVSVSDMEREGIEVGWLKKRLGEIYEAKQAVHLLKKYSDLKRSKAEWKAKRQELAKQLQVYQREFNILKGKIDTAQYELSVAEAENEKAEHEIKEGKDKIRHILELGTLVNDLI